MLYQTHRPFSLPSFTPLPLHLPPSSSSFIQVEQRMDCVSGGAFMRGGGGFRQETAAATHLVEDDENAHNGVAGDDFFVDDLLDFSGEDVDDQFVKEEEKFEEQSKVSDISVLPPKVENDEIHPTATNFSVKDDLGFVPGSELSVPDDDLADLEWLSNFVDDSFSQYSLTLPAGKSPEKTARPVFSEGSKDQFFKTPVQTKARTKRARTGGRVWSSSPATETSSSSSTSSSPAALSSSTTTSNPLLIYTGSAQTGDSFLVNPVRKKLKKKAAAESSPGAASGGGARRCSHCFVQKTPQWRSGPLGAKTLCNACGVRYKSGRLLPEYRPACSPTFSSGVHSNNHRKVLEMRQKKEVATGLTQPVQSF